jgi:hypothetical protein
MFMADDTPGSKENPIATRILTLATYPFNLGGGPLGIHVDEVGRTT